MPDVPSESGESVRFEWDADDPDVVHVDGTVFTVEELDRRL